MKEEDYGTAHDANARKMDYFAPVARAQYHNLEHPMSLDVRGLCPLLEVYDMPRSIAFYCDKLGFTIAEHAPALPPPRLFHWALLRLAGVELMLNTAYETDEERPKEPDAARTQAHGDTCLYFGCPDVDSACQLLRARGAQVNEPKIAPYGMKQLYLQDPDGYGICFQWPEARS